MVSRQDIREVYEIRKHFERDVYSHDTIANFVENRLLKEVLDGLTNRIIIVRRFAQLQPGYG
jgi:DNA-binding GntR family transcriptional regulator